MVIAVSLPLLVALVGLVLYFLSANPKIGDVGRTMFFCGLLACLLNFHGCAATVGAIR